MTDTTPSELQVARESLFTSGWRPAAAWVCVAALAWQAVGQPVGEWVAALLGLKASFPQPDATYITMILVPMMGFGAARTVEKIAGAQTSSTAAGKG
jgi:hypothetical protein